ncbi:MAG TPA: HAMP domain-containing sensor histidine kinase [Acidimicrobiales bacterium]|nr:HAMP domain-containing sensor histidine kinase [Acidimicrobiales bacterium]
MQRRLLRALLAVAVAGVVVLGVPLAATVSRFLHDEAARRLEAQAALVGFTVDDAFEEGSPIPVASVRRLLSSGQRATIIAPDHTRTVVDRDTAPPGDLSVRITTADRGVVILDGTDENVDGRVHRAWLLVAGLALGGVLAAFVVAVVEARRLTRPLRALAGYSTRIGAGALAALPPRRSGVAEIDEVGEALHAAAARIAALLERERQFSANATHQLRTPLTALRLRLEAMSPAGPEVDAALAQVDRLDATIAELVAFAREGRAGGTETVELAPFLEGEAARWRPVLAAEGRALVIHVPPRLRADVSPGALAQVLDVLVENARVHGAGAVTVSVRALGDHVVVSVGDEGAGVSDDLAARIFERSVTTGEGTGVGLALARALVEAEGGRLELEERRPARFAVFLRGAA